MKKTSGNQVAPSHFDKEIHTYVAGDQWQYNITGEQSLGGANQTVTGTETRAVSTATVNGQNVLAMTITDNLTVAGTPINEQTTNYFTQDSTTGDITFVGDTQGPGNTLRTATTSQVTQQGTFVAGSTQRTSVTYSNGDTQTSSLTINGHAFVNVPDGTFNTWQVSTTKTDSNGVSSNNTEFWDANLGNFVKAVVNGAEPGFTIQFTLSMTSSTVQPG